MKEVRDAIILAGGMGTRMLPASLFVPKETLPLVDTPLIFHQLWEAVKAGVSRVHIVVSEWKMRILYDHINNHKGNLERRGISKSNFTFDFDGVEIVTHIQDSPGGVADAIHLASKEVKGPFLVILGDVALPEHHVNPNLMGTEFASSASLKLVKNYRKNELPCVGLIAVPESKFSEFGMVELDGEFIKDIVEKPSFGNSPSNYALSGRYLFLENFNNIIQKYPLSDFGELQSIQLQKHLIREGGLRFEIMEGMTLYDSGNPYNWLISQIDHAIKRQDMGQDLVNWLENRISKYVMDSN